MPERPNGATYKHRRRAQSGPLEPAPLRCVPAQGRGELPVRAGTGPQASATRQCPPAEVAGESPKAQGPACAESSASSRPRSGRAARPLRATAPPQVMLSQPRSRPLALSLPHRRVRQPESHSPHDLLDSGGAARLSAHAPRCGSSTQVPEAPCQTG